MPHAFLSTGQCSSTRKPRFPAPETCCHTPADSPKEWAIAGYKPSTYCVTSTDTGVRVELRDFTW